MLEYLAAVKGIPAEQLSDVVDELAADIDARLGTPILPKATETVAVTFHAPKTAALFFDRVWSYAGLEDRPPDDVLVYGATDAEVWPQAILLCLGPPNWDWQRIQQTFGRQGPIRDLWAQTAPPASLMSNALFQEHGIKAIPMFKSIAACEREYRVGDTAAIVAAVEQLGVVDEQGLRWDQVMELRRDTEARNKLRRMRHWLDTEFVGKPVSFVSDALSVRLENYEWALRKHGIDTVLGSFADLLDHRFLPAALAATAGLALAGGEFWAAVGATGMLAGRAVLSVTSRLVDLADKKRGNHSEVAFIHQIRKTE